MHPKLQNKYTKRKIIIQLLENLGLSNPSQHMESLFVVNQPSSCEVIEATLVYENW